MANRPLLSLVLLYAAALLACGEGSWSPSQIAAPPCAGKCDSPFAALTSIDGLAVQEVVGYGSRLRFELGLDQPVDHEAPEGARFSHRATLLHRSADAPVVVYLNGYSHSAPWSTAELTGMLDANQLYIEHRFFGSSRPTQIDWSQLTISQAAADVHRFISALKTIYSGPWVSTGVSKGGMASAYHRRFYPDDVDATVVYVAPLYLQAPDDRYLPFFETVGTDDCRQRLADLQRELLRRRTQVLPLIAGWAHTRGYTYDRLGDGPAFEAAIAWLPWYFWQYRTRNDCQWIPGTEASDVDLVAFLTNSWYEGPLSWVADQTIERYDAYHVQRLTQTGHPRLPDTDVRDLMQTDPSVEIDAYLPTGAQGSFDETSMQDVERWFREDARGLIFVYGEDDPYTVGPFPLHAEQTYRFVAPAANHDASIHLLGDEDRKQALGLLGTWLGVPIDQ